MLKNLFTTKNNDLILGRKIHMDFGSFSYEEEAKNKQNENTCHHQVGACQIIQSQRDNKECNNLRFPQFEVICIHHTFPFYFQSKTYFSKQKKQSYFAISHVQESRPIDKILSTYSSE